MDYEKKYKEALAIARWKIDTDCGDFFTVDDIKDIFHEELKDSEDERIRKGLINMLSQDYKLHKKEIAWLEKQGEQKPVIRPVWYDNMDDLIADAMIDETNKSDMPESAKHNRIYWINSHRHKSIKWSEDDENMREAVIDVLVNNTMSGSEGDKVYSEEIDWLESLKPNHWKPSKEQIKSLRIALQTMPYSKEKENVLVILEQLLKL